MKNRLPATLLASLLLFAGCAGSYDILTVDPTEGGTYVEFAQGTPLREGDVLNVVGPIGGDNARGGAASHGRLRKVIGRIRIERLAGDGRVQVVVLEGTLSGAVTAERIN